MASGNRVEELETRVKELEASVTGLTDELLECKERLRTLEDEVGPEMGIIEGRPTTKEEKAEKEKKEAAQGDGGADNDTSVESEEGENSGAGTDEIIVA